MSEIGTEDIEIVTGHVRVAAGKDALDVYRTGDRLGMFIHPDKQTSNQLRDFFPQMLQGLLDLEENIGNRRNPDAQNTKPSARSEEEYDRLLQLTTAVSRVLYYPEDDDTWFIKRYGNSFTADAVVTAFPQKGFRPQYLEAEQFDFQHPSVWSLQVKDTVNNQRVFFEVFPTRHAPYPPKYAFLDGATPEVAKLTLTQQRVNPETINNLVNSAEAQAINPHMSLRLEGRNGRPIARVDGDLAAKKEGDRSITGFKLHIKSTRSENQPEDPTVAALEKNFVFLPLPTMQKDTNVPLSPFARALIGISLKKDFQVKQPAKVSTVRRIA